MHWVWLIIVGAIVGLLGRLFHPGRDPMGFVLTTLVGVASLVVAGLIFSSGVLQFVVGIVVAVILVAIVGRVQTRARPDLAALAQGSAGGASLGRASRVWHHTVRAGEPCCSDGESSDSPDRSPSPSARARRGGS